jgi:hypothetical protein
MIETGLIVNVVICNRASKHSTALKCWKFVNLRLYFYLPLNDLSVKKFGFTFKTILPEFLELLQRMVDAQDESTLLTQN